MGHFAGKSEKIQQLANRKAEGTLSVDDFHTLMAVILSHDVNSCTDFELPDANSNSEDQEASERDYSIAIAGALGIASLAAMVLLIVFVVAR